MTYPVAPPCDLGSYHLERSIGHGNFGAVYEAHDILLGRRVALKLVPIEDTQNPTEFLEKVKEASIQYRSRHSNVVQVNSVVPLSFNGHAYIGIDMEYVDGKSLQDELEGGFLSCQKCLTVFAQVLNGLEHLHSAGVIHRDIKPSNIMVARSRVRLADFGLAGVLNESQSLFGTAYQSHMPPECFAGMPFSMQTDIYAIGMTLFRCLNNISNWPEACSRVNDFDQDLRNGLLVESIGFEAYVPNKVRRIVKKATERTPGRRYQSASEMQHALNSLSPLIDWRRVSPSAWTGLQHVTRTHDSTYVLNISGRSVEVRRNGRRLQDKCQSYESHDLAATAAQEYIADTTLT